MIPMVKFYGMPFNLTAGEYINVRAMAELLPGEINCTPQGNSSAFIIKSAPLQPFKLTIKINPDSNSTAATITWPPL
jgi:hypothetical protein